MNIWIVNHYAAPPSSSSGMIRHYNFAKYLEKKGHSVKIITSGKIHNSNVNYIDDESLYVEKVVDGVSFVFVKSRDYKGNGIKRIVNLADFPFKIKRTMKRLCRQERPDIIYTSSPDIFVPFFALKFGLQHKIPVVTEVRDLWPESIVAYSNMTESNLIIRILYRVERWIYTKSDRIIFTMEGGKEYVREKKWSHNINMSKIHHINNGIDLEEFKQNLDNFKLDDEDLTDEDSFKVVYMGSIRKANHLEKLIEAADILKQKNYNHIKILVYGDGTERAALEQISRKKNLNVFFKGSVERKYIPYILSRANLNLINVMPSSLTKYGSSWNKLFEYMASGRPVLSNLPVNYDLIKKYNMGISEKFVNAEAYADSIIQMADMDSEEYKEMCNNASKAGYLYDYKKHTDSLEKILLELI